MKPATFIQSADTFVHGCRTVDLPDSDDELEQMLRTSETVCYELDGLAGRLWAVYSTECGTPPDLNGQCMRCGHKNAPAVAGHKPGCNPFALVITRAHHVAVRVFRLAALYRGVL